MNSTEIKSKISQKLEELVSAVEQLFYLSDNHQKDDFHYDLSKEKLIGLYNLICELQKQTENINLPQELLKVVPDIQEETPDVQPVAEQQTEIHHNVQENQDQIVTGDIQPKEQDFIHIPEAFEITDEIIESPTHQEELKEDPLSEPVSAEIPQETPIITEPEHAHQAQTLSDKLKKDSHSLHEKFNTGSEDKSIGSRMQSHPVQDLRKAIGINDRFSFISELFDGSKSDFDHFLDEICAAMNSVQIETIFRNTTSQRNWTVKPSYNKFNDLIQRYALTK